MNTATKLGLLATGLGLAIQAPGARAVVTKHSLYSNAVNNCQAFTPGPANTIRNRVVGAENIGEPMNVACNFNSFYNGASSNNAPKQLLIFFSNNNISGTISVNCTLLTGNQGQGNAYAVSKTTVPIPAGGLSQQSLSWIPADNPVAGSTDLGNYLIGINCTLPTGAVINQTHMHWDQDNGI